MAERIREVAVAVEVDTNKDTYKRRLIWEEDESLEEFLRRIESALRDVGAIRELSDRS